MPPEGRPHHPLPPSAYATHDNQGSLVSLEPLHSPGGSCNDSCADNVPSPSFRASLYRQSAILELGSAVPMEIGLLNGAKEIQIRRHSSVLGMENLITEIQAQRDILRRLSRDSTVPASYLQDIERKLDQLQSNHEPINLPWSDLTPVSAHRHSSSVPASPQAPSQTSEVLVSPLRYPPSSSSCKTLDTRQTLSSQRNSEEWVTAMESSGDDLSDDDRSMSYNATALESFNSRSEKTHNVLPDDIFDPRTLSNTSEQAADRSGYAMGPDSSSSQKLQVIGKTDNEDPSSGSQYSHSASGPPPPHSLPSHPAENSLESSHTRQVSFKDVSNQVLRKLSESEHPSEHQARTSSRRRRHDNAASHVTLQGESAMIGLDARAVPRDRAPGRRKEARQSQCDNSTNVRHRKQRLDFTKKSIEGLMEKQSQLDIDDIGLPGPERRLLERFIDSLSKLSIEVQMDERMRKEGIRRLKNALRALEGWI